MLILAYKQLYMNFVFGNLFLITGEIGKAPRQLQRREGVRPCLFKIQKINSELVFPF
jgi:hypothetical protein